MNIYIYIHDPKKMYIYRPLDWENQEKISVASWWDFWRESWPPHWFWTAIWRPFHRERRKEISSPRDETASVPFWREVPTRFPVWKSISENFGPWHLRPPVSLFTALASSPLLSLLQLGSTERERGRERGGFWGCRGEKLGSGERVSGEVRNYFMPDTCIFPGVLTCRRHTWVSHTCENPDMCPKNVQYYVKIIHIYL